MNTNTVLYSVRSWAGRRTGAILRGALLLSFGAATGCTDDDFDDAVTGDTYPLDADYATSAAYAGAYGDAWGAGLYSSGPGAGLADGGVAAAAADPIGAIHALAQGSTDVCPGQVDATPMTTNTPCGSDGTPGDVPSGVALNFQGCKLQGGGTLDGTVSLSRTETPSNTACDTSTTINVNYNATFTNFSYVASDGTKTVITSLTATGMYDHPIGGPPSTITAQTTASITRSDASGTVISDRSLSGNSTFALSGTQPNITVTATSALNVTGANNGGQGTLNMDSLKKEPTCCHATGGTVTVTGVENSTFQFGPSCGAATKNGSAITLGACP